MIVDRLCKSDLFLNLSRGSCYARVVKGVDSKSTAARRSGSNPDGSGFVQHCIMALTVHIRVTDTLKRCSVQTAAFDPELQRHHITLQQLLHSS